MANLIVDGQHRFKINSGLLTTASSNRFKCSLCGKTINKGNKFYRREFNAWRKNQILNMCGRCMVKMALSCGITEEDIGQIKKEIILENL